MEQQKTEKEICVCRIIDGSYETTFETEQAVDFLELARRLREMQQSGTLTGRELAAGFEPAWPIDQERYDLRVRAFMEDGGEIRGVFYLNLNRKKVSALDKAEGWWDYLIKDVSAALYYAARKEDRPRPEQRRIFLDRLRGKHQDNPLHPDAAPTFGMKI